MLFLCTVIFTVSTAYSKTFNQKVGVSIDTRKRSVIEEMVLKALVSDSQKPNGVYILWNDARDLREKGITKLNAEVLLEILLTNNDYLISLAEVKDGKSAPIGTPLKYSQTAFIDKLDNIVISITKILQLQYPPKEKQQMNEIEVVTKSLSQFEPAVPKWVPGLNLDYVHNAINYDVDILTNGSGLTNINYERINSSYPTLNLSPMIEYYYRNTYMKFMLSADTGMGQLTSKFIWGKGIFGSVIMVGLDLTGHYSWGFLPFNTILDLDGRQVVLDQPEVQYWYFSPGIFLKLNITRKYSIQLSTGSVPFGNLSMNYSATNLSTLGVVVESEGPAYIDLNLNFRVNSRLSFAFNYYFFGARLSYDRGDQMNKPVIQEIDGQTWVELNELKISSTYFGLGVRYEL